MHRIYSLRKVSSFFSSHEVLYIKGVKTTFGLWSFLIIFTKQPTKSGLEIKKMTGVKDYKIVKKMFYVL